MEMDVGLLAFHKGARDCIRAVLKGLSLAQVRKRDPRRKYSIAEEVGHIVAAEHFFLHDDMGIDPGFPFLNNVLGQRASLKTLRDILSRIERSWPNLLAKHPRGRELRKILARMGLHTLYHLPRIIDRRVRMDSGFRMPHWSRKGSWEKAIEPLLDLIER